VNRGFLFPASSPVFVVVCVTDDCHTDWSEVKSQFCFDLHFLYGQKCKAFLLYLLAIYISSFENCLFISFAHLFIRLLILLGVSFLNFLCVLIIYLLSDV
jgi:hypothetical protein